MKVALFLSAIAGASAFAPSAPSNVATSLAASADLESLRGGNGPETGGKIVRSCVSFFVVVTYNQSSWHCKCRVQKNKIGSHISCSFALPLLFI